VEGNSFINRIAAPIEVGLKLNKVYKAELLTLIGDPRSINESSGKRSRNIK